MRRRILLPVLLAAAATLGFLLVESGLPEGSPPEGEDQGAEAPPPGLLGVEGDASAAGPGLGARGAPRTTSPVRALARCVVTVVDARGEARAAAALRVRPASRPGGPVTHWSDGHGRLALAGVPLDGSLVVEALAGAHPSQQGLVVGRADIRAEDVRLVCTGGLDLEVVCIDAETGRRLERLEAEAVPKRDEPTWSKAARPLAVLPGDALRVGLDISKTRQHGRVAWDAAAWRVRVSRDARHLALVYPLRKQARVHVRALEHDGSPSDHAHVRGFLIAGRDTVRGVEAVPDRGGFDLRGVPFYRGQPLEVLVTRPPVPNLGPEVLEEDVEFEIREEVDTYPPTELASWAQTWTNAGIGRNRLPARWEDLCVVTARFSEDRAAEISFGLNAFDDGDAAWVDADWFVSEGPLGDVEVTVLRRDGSPAAGARVACRSREGRADVRGRVFLQGLPAGEGTVALCEPGLVLTTARVHVVAEGRARLTLREAEGGTLRVRVVDTEGEGLPCASVQVTERAAWADIDDGVQRVDPYTDAQGLRVLRRLPAGTWKLRARWGGLEAVAEATVAAGESREVTIALKTSP